MDYIPSQDTKIEKAILAGILLDREAIYKVIDLKPEYFYNLCHQKIFAAIIDLFNQNKAIDLLTLTNHLRNINNLEEIGGAYFISKLIEEVGSSYNIEHHVKIIYQLYLERETYAILYNNMANLANKTELDIYQSYNEILASLNTLFELKQNDDYHEVFDIIKERISVIEQIKPDSNDLIGISTGFSKLNKLTNGLQGGDYTILAARPSMGKTVISLVMAKAALFQSRQNVLYFSLEMSKERIIDRLISLGTGIDSRNISANRLNDNDWNKIEETTLKYKDKRFYIIDKAGLTIEQIRAKSIQLHRKFGIGIIYIDYLQLIAFSNKRDNTNDALTHISANIKGIAKELNIPIIALSQLSRANNGLPDLRDLRGSGSLEQDADIVTFIHRDDYQGSECEETEKNKIGLLVQKNRNGALDNIMIYRNDVWSYIGETIENDYLSVLNDDVF